MKIFFIFLFLISGLFFLEAIEISGDQSGTWTSENNPYEMIGEVSIPAGEILQIDAGVEVIAMGNYTITVLGNILANGIISDTIRFHGNGGLNWGGLRFENENETSELFYCRISNTDDTNDYGIHSLNSPILIDHCYIDDHQKGISFSALSATDPSYMEIRHAKIANITKSGITVLDNSNVLIDSCEITQCGLGTQYFGAIQLSLQNSDHNCSPEITNNHIHHNSKQGITMANLFNYSTMAPVITGNLIEYNLTGIYLYSAQSMVHNNRIMHNFIPGDANSGAGVMIYGASGNGVFTENEISGNFTGFYLTTGATANIGNVYNGNNLDDGMNYIHDNVDESGNLYSIYNDSSAEVLAQNNLWDSADPDEIAETIIDIYDSMTSGEVIFEPLYWHTIPPAPEDLEYVFEVPNTLNLSWQFEQILGFVNFNIYVAYNNGEFELLDTSVLPEFSYEVINLEGYYQFYITAVNVHGIESDSSNVVDIQFVDSDDETILNNGIYLSNYPNPFNPITTISFQLSEVSDQQDVELVIYNLKGQKVKTLNIEDCKLNINSVIWNGTDDSGKPVSSGIYFARLKAGKEVLVKKMALMK